MSINPAIGVLMKKLNPISEELIAPCGMNCAICSRYLAYLNKLNRSQCVGCRPGKKQCTYLFEKCTGINHSAKGDVSFCFECDQYPCKQINRVDARYRKNYSMSMKENLACIQKKGMGKYLKEQYSKYRCSKCGELLSIHNRKCFKCDTITRLVEKQDIEY